MTGVLVSPKLKRNCQAKQSALSSEEVVAFDAAHFVLLSCRFWLVLGGVQRTVEQSLYADEDCAGVHHLQVQMML